MIRKIILELSKKKNYCYFSCMNQSEVWLYIQHNDFLSISGSEAD